MSLDARGNRVVEVNKADLLEILKTNRESHEKHYVAAVRTYKKKAAKEVKALAAAIDKSKEHEVPSLYIGLPVPENHLKEYDREIKMLQMSIHDTAKLTEDDFNQFVNDEWSWSRSFAANTMSYGGDIGFGAAAPGLGI